MTTYFHDSEQRMPMDLAAGVKARTFWGDKMTLALVTLEPNSLVAAHSPPHEQVGTVIAGELDFTIGDETRRLKPGDVYVIPGDVTHEGRVGAEAVQLVEVFSPVRENFKY